MMGRSSLASADRDSLLSKGYVRYCREARCALIIANPLHPRGDPGRHDPEHLAVDEIPLEVAANQARDLARLPRSASTHPQLPLFAQHADETSEETDTNVVM